MKSIKIQALLFLLIFFFNSAYSQLWKQYSDSAKIFNDQRNTDKAIEYYIKSKEELKKDSLRTNSYAVICNNLAIVYINMEQFENAEPLFLEVKNLRENMLGKNNLIYAKSCNNLANLYTEMSHFEKAEPLYIEAIEINGKLRGKENAGYASLCGDLANFYKALNQYKKAEPLYLEALKIQEKDPGKDHPQYAATCSNLAVMYVDMGQYEKAEPLYLEAKNIREKNPGKETPVYIGSCNNLANLYMSLARYDKAEPLYIEAKQICEKVFGNRQNPSYALICNSLAGLYDLEGDYIKAEHLYLEALYIREKAPGKGHPDYAGTCNGLAGLYKDMGQYKKAEMFYLESKKIIESVYGSENLEYAKCCNNLASLYDVIGEYEKAEPLYLKAKHIREQKLGKENSYYAGSCNNLAALYYNMGQYEKAESLHIESKQIREKVWGNNHPEYAQSCDNLAALYNKTGQYEKAEPLYLEARHILEKNPGKEHSSFGTNCNNLALLYMNKNQYEKAEPLFLEAIHIHEKVLGKSHPDFALDCENLAILYLDMGQFEKAESLFLKAKKINEIALGKENPDYATNCRNLAILYWSRNKFEKTYDFYTEAITIQSKIVKNIFQFTTESEKQLYINKITNLEKYFLSFNKIANSRKEQGFTFDVSLANRNIILSSSQKIRNIIYNSSDTGFINKYNSWITSREQISFWLTKPIADRPAYVKDLEEQANTLEKELTRLSYDFKKEQSASDISWKNIQQKLNPNEATIEFSEFNYYDGKRWTDSTYYIALVLRKDKPEPVLVQLFEKKQLDKLLSSTENLATDNSINALYAGNRSLYNLTWKPLEKYLTGVSKVYFASAGNLFKISFAALPVNDKQVLGDKYQLVQLNTTASVVDNDQSNITAADKIQLYGGIRYDADSSILKQAAASYQTNAESSRSLPPDLERGAGFKYLPGTQQETEAIKKEIGNTSNPVTILSGTNATEESVKALTGKNSPSVLHIATHGFFFPDPKDDKRDSIQRKFETSGKVFKQSDNPLFRSGLLFAGANNAWQGKPVDGIEDGILTAYEVSNLYLPNTKLVVLSACETALGDIHGSEGVYGLQRAFKMAGVKNLVMSLWKVPDAETAEFMQHFYKNLFAKQTISNAFNNAQQVMKNKYRAEPYKWAAWVLVR